MQVFRAAALARTFGIAVAILWGTVGGRGSAGHDRIDLPAASSTTRRPPCRGDRHRSGKSRPGRARVLATDPQGRYRADALVPGKYDGDRRAFRASAPPRYQDVSLSVGQAAVLNVQMQIGGITERVVVAGDATLVATRQSAVTALVDQSQIRELPLNGRDFTQLTLLQLGVTSSPDHVAGGRSRHGHAGLGRRRPAEPDQLPGGRRGREHPGQRRRPAAPPAECSASTPCASSRCSSTTTAPNTAAAPADRRRPSRARARTATRDPASSSAATARSTRSTYFDDPTKSIPPLKRNQFGGTLGGPIVRDKDVLLRQLRRPAPGSRR